MWHSAAGCRSLTVASHITSGRPTMAIEKLNALVIGRRDNGQSLNIGGELCTRLTTSRWHLGCVLTSSLVEIHNDAGVSVHVYDPTNPQEFKDIVGEVGDGGSSIDWAVRIASMIGIAEPLKPGQKPNPITIINGELWDTVLKICALMNFVFADDEYLLPPVLGEPAQINEHDLARITSVNDRRRVVVTITNIPSDADDDDH